MGAQCLPPRELVGGAYVVHLLLGKLTFAPVLGVVLLEGFGDGVSVPICLDSRDDIVDLVLIVLAVLDSLVFACHDGLGWSNLPLETLDS